MKSPFWKLSKSQFDKAVSPDNLKINYMRSTYQNGGPLLNSTGFRYQNVTHEAMVQDAELVQYLEEAKSFFDELDTESLGLQAEFVSFKLTFP